MSRRIKTSILFVIIILFCCGILFAAVTGQSRIAIGADVGRQRIDYNKHYIDKATIGPGLKVEYTYRYDDFISFGTALTAGYYKYEDFHTYWDIRLIPEFKMHFLGRKGDFAAGAFYLSASIGIGPGLALREDKQWGVYGLFNGMISAGYEFKGGLAIGVDIESSVTFQNDESIISMIDAALVVSIPLGGKK